MKNLNHLIRQSFIIVVITFCSKSVYSQLFVGGKHLKFFVEITPDSAHVESYYSWRYHPVTRMSDECLVKNTNLSDTLYHGENVQLLKTRNGYLLLSHSNKKTSKIPLESCTFEARDQQRKATYLGIKQGVLDQLVDSLADSYDFRNSLDDYLLEDVNDSLELNAYKQELDRVFYKEQKRIISSTSLRVSHYYNVAHSINETDSMELFTLLDSADYFMSYGQYLLFQLSQENPALLVRYLDQEPENRRSLLRAIRHHPHYRQILASVKTVEGNTAGKRKVLRQKSLRIAGHIANGTISATLVLGEIALIVLLFVWIF